MINIRLLAHQIGLGTAGTARQWLLDPTSCQLMAKGCALSSGYLPREGLPRNSVDRITDRPNMTSAVDRGHKASTQTNKQNFP